MSRYREPTPKSSPYITTEGAERLRAEYDHLWRERRPEVVRALSAAAAGLLTASSADLGIATFFLTSMVNRYVIRKNQCCRLRNLQARLNI